jgi:DNA polymerase III delta subunit
VSAAASKSAGKSAQAAPPEQIDALARDVAAAPLLERAIVVRGDEEYFARRVHEIVTARAKALDYEVLVRDGADGSTSVAEVLGDLATAPMFAPRQLFVVRGFDQELKNEGKQPPPLVKGLLAFLERAESERALLLRSDSMRADHRIAKAATRVVSVRRLYDSPPPWKPDPMATELVGWVRRRAKELGLALEPRAVLYVAAATGSDLGAIDEQLERLAVAGPDALREVVAWQSTTTPWETAETFFGGEPARAIAAVVQLFANGMVDKDGRRVNESDTLAIMTIGQLVRTARQGLAIADARAAGASEDAALEAAGVSGRAGDAWRARLAVRAAPHEWARLFEDASELERQTRRVGGASVDHFVALALRWRASKGVRAS